MMDLFSKVKNTNLKKAEPLAARMRPVKLEDVVGQEEILAPGKLLRRAIATDTLNSVIFYGPPGTGKTTLANVLPMLPKDILKRLMPLPLAKRR